MASVQTSTRSLVREMRVRRRSTKLAWGIASPTGADRHRAKALTTAPLWIVRRVESVDLRDDYQVTRHHTVDFNVPNGSQARGAAVPHLPLMFMRKVPPVLNIDLRDEEGKSVPLLSRRENAGLSSAALAAALEHTLYVRSNEITRACARLASNQPKDAEAAFRELVRLVAPHVPAASTPTGYRRALRYNRLMLVARKMIGNSIIWVINDAPCGHRRVLKFAYEEPLEILSSIWTRLGMFLGLRSLEMGFSTPHLADCQSYHFEMSVSEELELRSETLDAEILEISGGRMRRIPTFFKTFRRDLHLYCDMSGTHTIRSSTISVRCRIGRRGFLSLALVAAMLIAALLWTGYLLEDRLVGEPASQVLPPVLLLIPAVLVGLVSRPGEHPFNSLLLTGPRYLILLSGTVASAAAAALAFTREPATSAMLERVWLGCALASTLIAVVVAWSWVSSLPRRNRGAAVAIGSGVAGAALISTATIESLWSVPWMLLVVGLAVACCIGMAVAFERRPAPPPPQKYFEEDLRAGGIIVG